MAIYDQFIRLIRAKQAEQEQRDQDEKEKRRAEVKRKREAVLSEEIPLDYENPFVAPENPILADNASDGLVLSLSNLGRVDIEYIASITGLSMKDIIHDLKGSIYQNPNTWGECWFKGFETKEEYLTGDLRAKLSAATLANRLYPGHFEANIALINTISANLPQVSADEIYFTLGSPWIHDDIVRSFVEFIVGHRCSSDAVRHDVDSGTWSLHIPFYSYSRVSRTFGTSRMDAIHIMENTLNQTPIVVRDRPAKGQRVGEKNTEETLLAIEKQKAILAAFHSFVTENPEYLARITTVYNHLFCQNYTAYFDGSFLKFPGMNPAIELFDYQKNAVARIIFTPNTLLAHDVGSGKTYEMIAAGHELIRMGLSKKNLYCVPTNLVEQWEKMYHEVYPNANILVVKGTMFSPKNRIKTLQKMRDGQYDAIIIGHSTMDLINLSPSFYKRKHQDELDRLSNSAKGSTSTTAVRTRYTALQKKSQTILARIGENDPEMIYFDDLGIDRLFLDESHNYKNIPVGAKMGVLGVSNPGSQKAIDMLDKVHFIQRGHNGGGIVFATGTPLTNSLSEVWVLQTYLQSGTLELGGLSAFPAWAANFAEKVTQFEIDVDTSSYRMVTRFSKFHNLTELSRMLSAFTDFHHMGKDKDLPVFEGYEDIALEPSRNLIKFLTDISKRAEAIRKHKPRVIREEADGNVVKDNMLLVTTDGRKAALDIRLINPSIPFSTDNKVFECAHNVFQIYQEGMQQKLTQVIFCDSSTPKAGFNVYDALRQLLITYGIPSEEIAYAHSYTTDRAREKLYKAVRDGQIRVVIGSTFKLGLGVNIQTRLVALHHLDIPWRPADMVQREGRIVRIGNINKKVRIFRYITKRSFDAYSWQLLEMKQDFISKLLTNDVLIREGSDLDSSVLSYAEVKAICVGDPLVKERVETQNEINRLRSLQRKTAQEKENLTLRIQQNKQRLKVLEDELRKAKKDAKLAMAQNLDTLDAKQKQSLGGLILATCRKAAEERKQTEITSFFGFTLVAPDYQLEGEGGVFVYLIGNGRYHIKLGVSELGAVTRLLNFLRAFDEYVSLKGKAVKALKADTATCEQTLLEKEDYSGDLLPLLEKLRKLDKQLGIN